MSEPAYYPSNETAPANKAALWSMVLGITGIVLSLAVIGGILGLIAAILGIVGVTRPGRKGMAITGITTGILSLPIALVAGLFWLGFIMAMSLGGARVGIARINATRAEIANLKSAVMTFEVDNGRYPTTAEGLDALVHRPPGVGAAWTQSLDRVPLDKWGNTFTYQGPDLAPDKEFNIISAGPDGRFGTPDDLDKDSP